MPRKVPYLSLGGHDALTRKKRFLVHDGGSSTLSITDAVDVNEILGKRKLLI